MRKHNKLLALILLLATIVSVFAVFGLTASAATDEPILVYDMQNYTLGKQITGTNNKNSTTTGKPFMSMTAVKDENGKIIYWNHKVVRDPNGDGTYTAANSSSNVYVNISPKNVYVNNGGGNTKNTDFVVIDFDLSTDSDFDYLYFQTKFLTSSGGSSQDHYAYVGGDTVDGGLFAASYKSAVKEKLYNTSPSESSWVNVTFVYDFRGTDGNQWKRYVYFDGIYAGVQKACLANAVSWNFIRFCWQRTGDRPISEYNMANFTMKRFPVGYNGNLGDENMLANKAYTLDQFSDMRYCLENVPAERDYAEVLRDGETHKVNSFKGLDTVLRDGDVVTLYTTVQDSLVVPKGANITFKDKDGNVLTPGNMVPDKISVAALNEVDYESTDMVVRELIDNVFIGAGVPGSGGAAGPVIPEAKVLNNLDNAESVTVNNANGIAMVSKTDLLGDKYWTFDASNYTPDTHVGEADPWISAVNLTNETIRVLVDDPANNRVKNTSYLIFDMDVSTDTGFLTSLYNNFRFCTAASTAYNKGTISSTYNGNAYLRIIGDGNTLKFTTSGDAAKGIAPVGELTLANGEWAHVTTIFDFSGNDPAEWKLYLYVNGVFVAEFLKGAMHKDAAVFYFNRLQVEKNADCVGKSTNIANYTCKSYDENYQYQIANLGDANYTLADIPAVAYAMENLPVTTGEIPEKELAFPSADLIANAANKAITVDLLRDATLDIDSALTVAKDVYFNLNGHTLTVNVKDNGDAFNLIGGAFQFKNGAVKVVNGNAFAKLNADANGTLIRVNGVAFEDAKYVVDYVNGGVQLNDVAAKNGNALIKAATKDVVVNVNKAKLENVDAVVDASAENNATINLTDVEVNGADSVTTVIAGGKVVINVKNLVATVDDLAFGIASESTEFNLDNAEITAVNLITQLYGATSTIGNGVFNYNVNGSKLNLVDALVLTSVVNGAETDSVVANYNLKNTEIYAKYLLDTMNAVYQTTAAIANAQNFDLDTCYIDVNGEYLTNTNNECVIEVIISGESPLSTKAVAPRGYNATIAAGKGYFIAPRSAEGVLGYCVTTNVTAYPYVIDGEEYEFYWYGADLVTYEKIPVELPNDPDSYFQYTWSPELDINGAYYPIMTVNVPVKANMNLALNFAYYVYLPADLGDASYNTVAINGEAQKVVKVVKGGVEYAMVEIAGVSVTNAADVLTLTLDVFDDAGNAVKFEKDVSITEYLDSLLNKEGATAEEVNLAAGIINYIDKAYALLDKPSESLDALTDSAAYTAVTLEKTTAPEAEKSLFGAGVADVSYVLNGGYYVELGFAPTTEGNILLTYYVEGEKTLKTVYGGNKDSYQLEIKACDLLKNISVRYANVTYTFNFAGYCEAVAETAGDNTALLNLLDALWIYSECATAYQG